MVGYGGRKEADVVDWAEESGRTTRLDQGEGEAVTAVGGDDLGTATGRWPQACPILILILILIFIFIFISISALPCPALLFLPKAMRDGVRTNEGRAR